MLTTSWGSKSRCQQHIPLWLTVGLLLLGTVVNKSLDPNSVVAVYAFSGRATSRRTTTQHGKHSIQLILRRRRIATTVTTRTTIPHKSLQPTSDATTTRLHLAFLDPWNNNDNNGNGNNGGCTNGNVETDASLRQKGILVLATVPLAWGTFEPAVRLVYQIQPDIPPFVFSFLYYLVAATPLCLLALAQQRSNNDSQKEDAANSTTSATTSENSPYNSTVMTRITESTRELVGDNSTTTTTSNFLLPLRGGFELGTYLFLGNGLQVVGLKTVPADRAAILLQLTTIFVPLMQAITAKDLMAVPPKTWLACFIALGGVALVGLDGATRDIVDSIDLGSLSSSSLGETTRNLSWSSFDFTIGDLWVVLAAVAYTFHCIRLENFAKTTSAVKLAAAKATTETMWSFLVVVACLVVASSTRTIVATTGHEMSTLLSPMEGGEQQGLPNTVLDMARRSGENILEYFNTVQADFSPTASAAAATTTSAAPTTILQGGHEWLTLTAAISWVGLVTVAYTIVAQSYGQAYVVPATANLIYTIQPLFTAFFAWIVLGETLGPAGYLGGALIGTAVLLVTQDDAGDGKGSNESA
jgi:drug/metabolite transporter (DMT)-like permease